MVVAESFAVPLHNAFVLAILGQIFAHTPPPDVMLQPRSGPPKSRDGKKAKTVKEGGACAASVVMLVTLVLTRLCLAVTVPIKSHLRDTSGIRNPKKMWIGQRSRPLLATTTPQLREIRQRMMAVAEEEGLERVEDAGAWLFVWFVVVCSSSY